MSKIPLASTGLRPKDITAAISVLNSNNLTMGSKVREFEQAMADYLKVDYFIMVNSGSSANLLIFEALIRPSDGKPLLNEGDGVLVPAVAWPTTIWPIIQLGLRPIFVDVNPDTLTIDLSLAQGFIGSEHNIRAIFPIHSLGYGINHDLLNEFCAKNDLIQINDVCEALGSWRQGIHAGTTGVASSFSFYFSHHITTMEGGGVATNDPKIADDLRAMRSHGWSRDRSDAKIWADKYNHNLVTKSISQNQLKFQFVTTGYNLRPMEIQAAIGIEQLSDLDSFIIKRREIAKQIKVMLKRTIFTLVDGGSLSSAENEEHHSWMFLCIKVNKPLTPSLRKKLDYLLESYEIESRPVLTGNFLEQPVMRLFDNLPASSDFPIANLVSTNYFMVSAHHDLSDAQIEYMGSSLISIANQL